MNTGMAETKYSQQYRILTENITKTGGMDYAGIIL